MSGLLNVILGFVMTAVVVLAVVYLFNAFTSGGVAQLGKAPIGSVLKQG